MKKEDLKVGQKLWLHHRYGRNRDYEVFISRIAKKYLYVVTEVGYSEEKFNIDTFENYEKNYSPSKVLYFNKEEKDMEDMVSDYKHQLREGLINYLTDEETIELYNNLKNRKNGISNNNHV